MLDADAAPLVLEAAALGANSSSNGHRGAIVPGARSTRVRCIRCPRNAQDTRRNACYFGMRRNVVQHYGICAYFRVIADVDGTENFRARSDVHMSAESRYAVARDSQRHLLEEHAVRSDFAIGMDHDPVGVRQQQPAAYACRDRDISSRYGGPNEMSKSRDLAAEPVIRASATCMPLIRADTRQERARGGPLKEALPFAAPIRNGCRHFWCRVVVPCTHRTGVRRIARRRIGHKASRESSSRAGRAQDARPRAEQGADEKRAQSDRTRFDIIPTYATLERDHGR